MNPQPPLPPASPFLHFFGEGHGLEWPVRELLRWQLVAEQGVAVSGIVRFVVLGIGIGNWSPRRLCQG